MENIITNDVMDASLSFNRRNLCKFKRVHIWKNLKLDGKDMFSFFLLNDLSQVEKIKISTMGQIPLKSRRMLYESSPHLEYLFISQGNLPIGRNLRSHFPKLKEIYLEMVKIVQLLSKLTNLPHKSLKKLLFHFEDPSTPPRVQKNRWHRLILLYPQLESLRDSCFSRSFFCMENVLLRRHTLHLRELSFNTVSWLIFDEDGQDCLPCKFTELNCSLYKKIPRLDTFRLFTKGIQKLSLQVSINLSHSDFETLFSSLPNVQDLSLKFYSGVANTSVYLFLLLHHLPKLQRIAIEWSNYVAMANDFITKQSNRKEPVVIESLAVHHKILDSLMFEIIASAVDIAQLVSLEIGGLTANGFSLLETCFSKQKNNKLQNLTIKGSDLEDSELSLFFKRAHLHNLEKLQIIRSGGNKFESEPSIGLILDEKYTPQLTEFSLSDACLSKSILSNICSFKSFVRNLSRLTISGDNTLNDSVVKLELENLFTQAEEFKSLKHLELTAVALTVADVINLICCPFPSIESIVALASPKITPSQNRAVAISEQCRWSNVKRIKVNYEVVLTEEFKRMIMLEKRLPYWKEIQLPQNLVKNYLIKKTQSLDLGKRVKWVPDEKKFLRMESSLI